MKKEALTAPALEELLQAPSLAILAVDKQGCVILWSPSASRMFGWTESEVLGRFLPIVPEEHRQGVYDRIQTELKGEITSALDVRRLQKDGSLVDVSLWTAPLRDSKGEVIGILGLYADITARKHTEEALRESELELRRVLGAASDYFWSGDIGPEGRFRYRYYSTAVERITGRPADFYMAGSERWMSTVHPEDRARLAEISARLLSGQLVSSENEHRIVLPDGTIRWVRANVTVSQSADGYRRLDGVVSDITARKQAEEALRESEARFRGIFTAAASGIVLVSPEGRFLHANPAFCEFLGYSEQELFSKRVQDVTHPDDRERTAEIRRGVWEGEVSLIRRYEKRYLRKDGQTVWGEVSISLIRDAMGNANYSISQVLDVTERKRAEMALQESEERFRALIEHGFDVIAVVKADGTTQFASASTARVLGYQPHELVGHNALELVHPEDLPRVTKVLDRLLETPGGTMTEQFRCRHKDGSWRWVEASGTNCLAQPAVGGIILNYRDITEHKQADEVLRESEQRYRTLAESAADAIFIIDRDDRVRYLNTHAASMLGSTPKELTGKRRAELFPPDTSEHQRREIKEVFESGRPRQIQNRTPFPGGELWLDTQLVPLRSAGGEVRAVMGISRDVTDQKRAEERLEERVGERTAELVKANEALRNSEAKYRTLVEEIPAITYIAGLDEASTTLYVSPQVEPVLGLTPADYKANPDTWRQHMHPDDLDRVMAELKRTHANHELFDCEYRMLHRTSGEIVWMRDKAVVVRDEAGQPLFLQGMMLDVTERHQAEETMQLQSTALQAADNGIVITDREGHIVWINPAFTKLTGYELSEVIGKNPRVLKSGRHDKAFYQDLWHTVLSGRVWHGEMVNKRKDGSLYTEEMTITPVRNAAGEIAHFIAIKQDITEWKSSEESRRHLAAIVESSDDAIFSGDLDGTITSWNAAAQRLYNYATEEILGRPVFVLVPRNRRGEVREIMKKLQGDEHIQHFETVRLKKGGVPVDVSVTVSLIKNDAGQVVGVSVITRDITERKELERAIVEVSGREQRRIGQDLHDSLCQQLTGIAYLWKTVADKVVARQLPEATEVAEIGRLITMTIDEAHGLARGLCPVELENNDIGLALKELGSSVERLFGISCTVRCQRPLRLADKAVALHLYRIAQEAISNAIHHGKAAHVWINFVLKKKKYTLWIRDNGVGFPGEQLCGQGTGIRGMRYRAQMIGAMLKIERELGGGTRVTCVGSQGKTTP